MIRSFRDRRTEDLFHRRRVKGLSHDVERAALRKLVILDAAESLDDLRVPPGNRLEKLKGDRRDEYSIRVSGSGSFFGEKCIHVQETTTEKCA